MLTVNANQKEMESVVLDKYQDLLDTILVMEAMKSDNSKNKTWKEFKILAEKNV